MQVIDKYGEPVNGVIMNKVAHVMRGLAGTDLHNNAHGFGHFSDDFLFVYTDDQPSDDDLKLAQTLAEQAGYDDFQVRATKTQDENIQKALGYTP